MGGSLTLSTTTFFFRVDSLPLFQIGGQNALHVAVGAASTDVEAVLMERDTDGALARATDVLDHPPSVYRRFLSDGALYTSCYRRLRALGAPPPSIDLRQTYRTRLEVCLFACVCFFCVIVCMCVNVCECVGVWICGCVVCEGL